VQRSWPPAMARAPGPTEPTPTVGVALARGSAQPSGCRPPTRVQAPVRSLPARCGLLAAVARLAVGAGAGPWPPSPGATPRPSGPGAGVDPRPPALGAGARPRPLAPIAMPEPPATGSRCGPPASSREGHGVLPLSVWVWVCERIGRRDEKTRVRILTQPFYTLVGRM